MYYLSAEIEVPDRVCARILRDTFHSPFMRRVRAENTCISRYLGSRAKRVLLGLCACRVIYPESIKGCGRYYAEKGRMFRD